MLSFSLVYSRNQRTTLEKQEINYAITDNVSKPIKKAVSAKL